MNFYDLERFAHHHTSQLEKEAAVVAVVRAGGAPNLAQTTASALRRLASRLDGGFAERAPRTDIAQPTVSLARRAA